MNHIYRLKRTGRTLQLQPVPETTRSAGKGQRRTGRTRGQVTGHVVASVALAGLVGLTYAQQAPPTATQLPQGGVVSRGSATISTSVGQGSAQMSVNQTSNRAVIDWTSFNLGANAKVQFNQPSSSAVVLNQVLGNNASQIYGQISANGQVFLSNPNGVYFSPTAQVNVGGLVATTGKANVDDFMAGKASFSRDGSSASVVNEGHLQAGQGGYIALLAPEVRNQGVVVAQAGTVALATGEAITLNFNNAGTGLVGLTTTAQAIAALVDNRSAVLAEGGQIILSAHALATLQNAVVSNSGQLSATSLVDKGGKIVLMGDTIALTPTSRIDANGPNGGGTVLVGGDWQGSGDTRQATRVTMEAGATIDANATDKGDGGKVVLWSDVHNADSQTTVAGSIQTEGKGVGTRGGQIETSGARLQIADSASIRMGGTGSKDGMWLLDPKDFTIASSGGDITGATLSAQITAGNTVEVLNTSGASGTAGNINVNDSLSWSNTGTLKLSSTGGVTGSGNIAMTGGGTLIFNQSTAVSSIFSGVVSGNGSVIKQGVGGQTLASGQTYTGSTTITGGGMEFDGGIATSDISLSGGGVILYIANAGSRTVASNISGSGTLTLAGFASTHTLTGDNTNYSGTTTIENTSAVLGSSSALGTGSISLVGKTGLTYTGLNTVDYSSKIIAGNGTILTVDTGGQNVTWTGAPFNSTNGALIKNGTGTLVLSGNAVLAGNTTAPATPAISVKAGTLVLGGTNTLGANFPYGSTGVGIVIDAGATLQVGNGSTTGNLGSAVGVGATTVTNNGTLTFNRSDTALSIANSIQGTGVVVQAGTGDVTLSSTRNSYSGGTRLLAGNLIPSVNNNTPGPGYGPSLGLNGTISFEGGGLKYLSGTDTNDYSPRFSTAANQAYKFDLDASVSKTWASALTSNGGTLTLSGGGLLILSNDNTYSGSTTVSAGQLQLGNGGTTGSVAGNIVLGSNTTKLIVNRSGNFTLSNTVSASGTAGNLIVSMANDSDVVTLDASNNFGYVQLTQGALGLGSANAIGTSRIYFSGGRLQYSSANTTDYSNKFGTQPYGGNNSQPYALDTNGQTVTLATALTDYWPTTPFKKYGTGTLILGANATYTGASYVYGGTLQVGTGAAGGAWTTSAAYVASGASLVFKPSTTATISTNVLQDPTSSTSGSVSFVQAASGDTTTYSGRLYNAVALVEAGPGKLLLTGNASSTGTTTINTGGTLQVGNADATGVLNTGDITNNGTLIYNRSDARTLTSKISGTGGLVKQGALALTLTGANDYTGNTTLSAGTLALGSASALGTSGTLSFGGGTLQFSASNTADYSGRFSTAVSQAYSLDTNGQNVTLGSALSSSGGTLTKLGSGTLTLAGANSYTGATTVSAGTLAVTHAAGLGTTAAGTTVASGATLDLQGVTVGSEAMALSGTLATSTGTSSLGGAVTLGANATVNVSGSALTLGGSVSGAYTLTKSGSGSLTLAAANTYSATTLSAGTLRLAHSTALGGSSITVPAGTTLELGALDGNNLNVTGKTITLASSGTFGNGGFLHNVAGANTWSGAITLQNNSTVTVDTGTSLNLSSASSTVAAAAVVSLKPNDGNLSFGTLTGSGGAAYIRQGTGSLSGNFVGLTAKSLVYARPVDASNQYSSDYGSTPGYSLGFFSASTGGTQYNLVSGTDYTGTIVYSGAPTATSVPGSYTFSYTSGATLSNAAYYLVGAGASTAWTVAPKPLTITAVTASKTYDGLAYSGGSVSYSAFANGQSAFDLSGMLTYGGTAQGAINAGSYTLTASGLSSSNYAITYVAGSLTVDKANLSKVTAAKTYDGLSTVTAAQMTAIEGVSGETFSATAGTANISDKNVAGIKTLTDLSSLTLSSANGGLSSNYNLSTGLPAAGNLNRVTIDALALQVSGVAAQNKTYDGNTTATLTGTAQVASLAGDAVTVDASGMAAQFGSTAVGTALPVTVTGYALTGAAAGNYSLRQPMGLSADIVAAKSNAPAVPVLTPSVPPAVPVSLPSVQPSASLVNLGAVIAPSTSNANAVPAAPAAVASEVAASPTVVVSVATPAERDVSTDRAAADELPSTNERATNNRTTTQAATVTARPQAGERATGPQNPGVAPVPAGSGALPTLPLTDVVPPVSAAALAVAAAPAVSPSTTGGAGLPNAPAGTGAQVQVVLVKPASVQNEGVVNVRVAAEVVSSASSLVIPLAEHLDWRQLQSNEVSVKLPNGMNLPEWMQYQVTERALVARVIPPKALPLQVMVQLGDRRYLVDIRESDFSRVGAP